MKLEMPIKCPSEDVRWAVTCTWPKCSSEAPAGDKMLDSSTVGTVFRDALPEEWVWLEEAGLSLAGRGG